jgi:hypothetical protein
MPVEPTKNKLKRRTSRCEDHRFDPSHGRELELKRNRGLSALDSSLFLFIPHVVVAIPVGEVFIIFPSSPMSYSQIFRLAVQSVAGMPVFPIVLSGSLTRLDKAQDKMR